MKKLFVTLLIALVPALAMAQLVMSPDGLISQRDGKNYLVLETEGNQQELFEKSLTYLNGLFNSPLHAISKVEGHSITVNGFSARTVKSAYKKLKYTYDLDYSISFEFKDGKVKYQVNSWAAGPLVNVGDFKPLKEYYGVYSESLELQNELAKTSLENFFNSFLSMYDAAVLTGDSW